MSKYKSTVKIWIVLTNTWNSKCPNSKENLPSRNVQTRNRSSPAGHHSLENKNKKNEQWVTTCYSKSILNRINHKKRKDIWIKDKRRPNLDPNTPGPSLKTKTGKKTKEIPTILSLMFDWKLHHAVSLQTHNQTVQLPCYNFCQMYAFPQTPMMK